MRALPKTTIFYMLEQSQIATVKPSYIRFILVFPGNSGNNIVRSDGILRADLRCSKGKSSWRIQRLKNMANLIVSKRRPRFVLNVSGLLTRLITIVRIVERQPAN
jgi:hypothetical protein